MNNRNSSTSCIAAVTSISVDTNVSNNTTTTPIPGIPPSTLIAVAVIIVLAIVGAAVFATVLIILLRNKKNSKTKERSEPDYYYAAKTEAEKETVYTSPQHDYYSTVDKDHTKDGNKQHTCATTEELHNSIELQLPQVYDNADVKKVITPPSVRADKAENMTQMYAEVDKSIRKAKMEGQEKMKDATATESPDISEMYAIVHKKAPKRCEKGNINYEYAVADKSSKKANQSQKNTVDVYSVVDERAKKTNHDQENVVNDEYAVIDKSDKNNYRGLETAGVDNFAVDKEKENNSALTENIQMSDKLDPSHTYSVVMKTKKKEKLSS